MFSCPRRSPTVRRDRVSMITAITLVAVLVVNGGCGVRSSDIDPVATNKNESAPVNEDATADQLVDADSVSNARSVNSVAYDNSVTTESTDRVTPVSQNALVVAKASQPGSSQPASSQPASSKPASSQPASSQPASSQPYLATVGEMDLGTSLAKFTGPIPDRFVGSQTCKECHLERWRTYIETSHSRSLRGVSSEPEQPVMRTGDAVITHATSKRTYDVHVDDGIVYHREFLHFIPDGQTPTASDVRMKLADLPVQWIMGSGTFAEAYLLRDEDGHLLQSPVTYYSHADEYGMAPGYDRDGHHGLTRVIDQQCMFCHAGLLADVDPDQVGATNFPRVAELAIGCERCHGPGAEHTSLYRNQAIAPESDPKTTADSKIVNPNKLDRVALDAICAQCHLQGSLVVAAPGKTVWDFRPGEDFAKTRVSYEVDGYRKKSFVGHFDQMWQSECYTKSETLACISCHDPHHEGVQSDLDVFYREKCFTCHDDHSCGVALPVRIEKKNNDCVACHMPVTASEVAHAATTNHRIGIHSDAAIAGDTKASEAASKSPADTGGQATLRRLTTPAQKITPADLARMDTLAQAFWVMSGIGRSEDPEDFVNDLVDCDRQLNELMRTYPQWSDEVWVLLTLAQVNKNIAETTAQMISREKQNGIWQRVEDLCVQAVRTGKADGYQRLEIAVVLAAKNHAVGDMPRAVAAYLECIAGGRREESDQYNLALCAAQIGDQAMADRALRTAIKWNGDYPPPYRSLSILYQPINIQVAKQMQDIYERIISN